MKLKEGLAPSEDKNRKEKLASFDRLLTMMDELRQNCPWDQKQTLESLKHLTIEEVYELNDAITDGDMKEVKGELGDILLHIVFYARIASEKNDFDIKDVVDQLIEKMVRRHPHIYGDVNADDEVAVKKNWEQIKMKEGKKVLSGVPRGLPAMIKAIRIQEKARSAGFDWDRPEEVYEKVKEEFEEFSATEHPEEKTDEFGDILFSMINYARFVGINPEQALERTNQKFIKRFNYLEEEARKAGKKLDDMPLSEMEAYWQEAKKLG